MAAEAGLTGKKLLVVEDDYLLAREICAELEGRGASVIGPAPTVHYAELILGQRHIDGAILDIRLFGEEVYPFADGLIARGVPILFATAYDQDQIAPRFRHVTSLQKPVNMTKLCESLITLASERGAIKARPAQPIMAQSPERGSTAGAQKTWTDRWSTALAAAMKGDI
jgi:DNA-binding response OmpR family regulator